MASQRKLDDDKINHHEDLVVTNVSIQDIQPDIAKVLQDVNLQQNAVAAVRKEVELPWRITPSNDQNKLVKHYLMLSKIRLTCK